MDKNNSTKIGLVSATIICMNAMIGAGIFTTPAKLATSVGPAGIITYLFVIIAVLFMAISLSKVAQSYPQEGSFYTYTKQWGGHFIGTLAAGAYVLGVVIALGLLAQIASQYFHDFIPWLSPQTIGFILIFIIVGLNAAGIKIIRTGQIFLLTCTLFALFSTIILCLFNADTANLTPFMPYGFSSLASATSTAIFAFFGFESAASLYSIVKKPEQNVPRALTISLLIVGTIYLTFIGSIILAIPAPAFTSPRIPLSEVISSVFPHYSWLSQIIGFAILTAICGVLQSMSYSASTLAFSFLKLLDHNWSKTITKAKNGFQIIVFIVGIFIIFNFFAVKSMGLFFNFTALFIVFAFACSILTLVIKKHDKTIGQKIITGGGLITAGIIFLNALYGILEEILKLF